MQIGDYMDRLGMSEEDLRQALNLILERRRVSQDLLKAHFGSSARATNMLSLLEINGFIDKPEGSSRWEIDFNAIQSYLAGNTSTTHKIPVNKGPKTIKNLGLQQILDSYDFSNRRLNLAKVLTADLSIEEIISSLEIIQRKYEELDEFNRIYPQLEDKIQKFEENCKELEEEQQGLEYRLDQDGVYAIRLYSDKKSVIILWVYLFGGGNWRQVYYRGLQVRRGKMCINFGHFNGTMPQ